jgi:hypothetical protein
MKRKFGFQGKMKDVTDKRKKGRSYGYLTIPNGVDIFQLPNNTCKVTMDVLPYKVTVDNHPDSDIGAEKGVYWFKRPFKLHRNIGVNPESAVCPNSIGKPCPICEYKRELYKSEGNEAEIDEIRLSKRNLYAVVVHQVDKIKYPEPKIQLFEFSDKLFEEVMEEQLEDDPNWENFALPDEGSSLVVRFSEDSFGKNKYPKATRFDLVERDEQYDEAILDEVPNLDECLTVLEYDALKNLFFNVVSDDEPETDEKESEPETPRKARGFRKREEVVEDDAPAEPENKEEEEEEEEKPRQRVRRNNTKDKVDTRCPFGHVFGKDYDAFEDCDDCDVWRDCRKENRS